MSGLREIIEWVERELILDPTSTADREFEEISDIFERDNRSALADILRDDTGKFLEFLESRLSELPSEPETDKELEPLESRIRDLESDINELPKRVVETVSKEPTGIIESIKGFLRGLFS